MFYSSSNENVMEDKFHRLQFYSFAEEVLEDSKALWFSPNGTKLVYATMNDTNVRNVTFWKYGDPGNLDSQYVQEIVFKYPKVSVDRFKSKLLNLSKESIISTNLNVSFLGSRQTL